MNQGNPPRPGDRIFYYDSDTRAGMIINTVELAGGLSEILMTVPVKSSPETKYTVNPDRNVIRLVELPAV